LHYIFVHLNLSSQKKKIIIFGYIFAFISLAFNFTPLFVKSVGPKMWFKYWPDAGVVYYPFLVIWFWFVLYGVYIVAKSLGNSTGITRNQLRYILIATIVGWSGGATNYPLWFNIKFPPIGNILVSFYIVTVTYAIIKYRLMDVNVFIGKGFVYGSLLAIIAGSYFGLMLGADKVFSGFSGYNAAISHFLIFLLVITVLIFILPKMRTKTERVIEKAIFKDRYAYRGTLKEFNKHMGFILSEDKLLSQTIETLSRAMGISRALILLYDEVSGNYIVSASVGLENRKQEGLHLSAGSSLVNWLSKDKKTFLKEEVRMLLPSNQTKLAKTIEKELKKIDLEIYIPLTLENSLLGIMALGEKGSGEVFSQQDIDILEPIAHQLALCVSYKRLESQVVHTDKLTSLGTLAAGMAHEIRNPLSSIQIFAQLLPEKYNDKDFRDNFSKIVTDDTGRISKIIDSIMALAKSGPASFSQYQISEIIDEALVLLSAELKEHGIGIVKKYKNRVLQIKGDKEELKQVFLNLLLNAVQSMADKKDGRIIISTSNDKDFIRVEIVDNGPGIEQRILNRLFDPFFTTKHKGTGLGLAISRRIIEEHKGAIKVKSKLGKGSVFWVDLPAAKREKIGRLNGV
ncbi:MAG: ATP-binding protein, partial [Candidatus Omnitrophota bacterium]|nr:ATP-binding protein [Candidatus Omnitrophota bacterium]